MKIRQSFVSNSSSSSFIIVNKTDKEKSLLEFIDEIGGNYSYHSKEKVYEDAKKSDEILSPGKNQISFSDDGDNEAEAMLRNFLDTSYSKICDKCGHAASFSKWKESQSFKWRTLYNTQSEYGEYTEER